MFALARGIVRHKVGTVAVIAIAVFFFSTDQKQDREREAANNPWAVQAVAERSAPAQEAGFVDQAVDAGLAYLDEAGINPVGEADETVERLDNTAAAMAAANRNN